MEDAPAEPAAGQQIQSTPADAQPRKSKVIVRSARIGSKFDSVAENLRAESIFDPKAKTIRIRFISKADQKAETPITVRKVVEVPYASIQEVNSDPKSLDLILTVGDGSSTKQFVDDPTKADAEPTPTTFIDAFKEPTIITIGYNKRNQLGSQRNSLAGICGIEARPPRERPARKQRLEVVGHAATLNDASAAPKKGAPRGKGRGRAASGAASAATFAVAGGVSEYVFYAVETAVPSTDVIEFGAVVVDAASLAEQHSYSTLLRSTNVTDRSVKANGITADEVANAPTFADVAPLVFALLNGRYWVGHNIARTDNQRIKEQFAKVNQPAPVPAGIVDTLSLLQTQFAGRTANFRLPTVMSLFGLRREKQDRSLEDIRRTIEMVKRVATVLFLEQHAGVAKPQAPPSAARGRGAGRGKAREAQQQQEGAADGSGQQQQQQSPGEAKPQRGRRQPGDRRKRNSETQEPAADGQQQDGEAKRTREPRPKATPAPSEAIVSAIDAAMADGKAVWVRYTGGGSREGPGYPREMVPKEWVAGELKNSFKAECRLGRPLIKTFRADRVSEVRDYDWNTELYAADVELGELGAIRDEPSLVAKAFETVKDGEFSVEELRRLFTYSVPKLSPDGTCSLVDQLDPLPFDLAKTLHGGRTPDSMAGDPEALRLFRLNKVVELLQERTKVDWLGIYRRAVINGETVLVKEAYYGEPSRAVFPVTPDFATKSNNAWVALEGKAKLIQDIKSYQGPYYECSKKVQSECCVPILSDQFEVLGIIDAECFQAGHFTPEVIKPIVQAAYDLGSNFLGFV